MISLTMFSFVSFFWVDFKYVFYNLLVKKVNLLEWVVTLDVKRLTLFYIAYYMERKSQ